MDDLVQDLKKWESSECKIPLNGGTAVLGQLWGLRNGIPFWRLGFGKRSGQQPAYTPRTVIWLSSHSRERLPKPCCWEKNVNVIYKCKTTYKESNKRHTKGLQFSRYAGNPRAPMTIQLGKRNNSLNLTKQRNSLHFTKACLMYLKILKVLKIIHIYIKKNYIYKK